MDTKLGHAAGEDAVATGDLEYRLAWLQIEQAFAGGGDEEAVKVVAFTHFVVPERGFLVPYVAGFFIQVDRLRCVFGSHGSSPLVLP